MTQNIDCLQFETRPCTPRNFRVAKSTSFLFLILQCAWTDKFHILISYISYIELRMWNQVSYGPRSWEHNFSELRIEAWKIQDLNGVWTRDLAIPVRLSNQLANWSLLFMKTTLLHTPFYLYHLHVVFYFFNTRFTAKHIIIIVPQSMNALKPFHQFFDSSKILP